MFSELAAAVGLVPSLASRAFVPCFAAACVLRFGPEFGFLADAGLLAALGVGAEQPAWFTSDTCLVVLGLLAALEIAATKQPDARALLNEIEPFIKPAVAILTVLGYASVADLEFVEETVVQAGFGDWFGAASVGGAVFVMAQMRTIVLSTVFEADEDDDSGLQGLLSWLEDVWSLLGIVLVILLPILMLVIAGLGIAGLWLLRRHLEKKEESRRVACSCCGESMYSAAPSCPECRTSNPQIRALTWLGVAGSDSAKAGHLNHLKSFRRCSTCAGRLTERKLNQACPVCSTDAFADSQAITEYDAWVKRKLPKTLVIVGLFGLVPVVGLIPAMIYGRLTIVAPYRRYIPRVRSMFMRFALRLLLLIAIMLQFIPGVGAVLICVSTLVSHRAYRHAFLRQEQSALPERSI